MRINLEIRAEEILSFIKFMDNGVREDFIPYTVKTKNSLDCKNVRIKDLTPDAEINSWEDKLERGSTYAVLDSHCKNGVNVININGKWYDAGWFEIVS